MGGIGGRVSMLMRENVRFRELESGVDEDDRTEGGGVGGESPRERGGVIYGW
jgi:hypothetical protein